MVVVEEDDVETERASGLGGTIGAVFVASRLGRLGDSRLGEVLDLLMPCSQSKEMAVEGLAADGAETFSNDSAMLAVSISMVALSVSKVSEGGLLLISGLGISIWLPSDERETEWKEEMEDAEACPTRAAPNLCAPGG